MVKDDKNENGNTKHILEVFLAKFLGFKEKYLEFSYKPP
jgi:hypothetical protein